MLERVNNIVNGFISAVLAIFIWVIAGPFIKEFIDITTESTGPVVSFLISILPFAGLFFLILFLVVALRGGVAYE